MESNSTVYFEQQSVVDLHSGIVKTIDRLNPHLNRVFGCFIANDYDHVIQLNITNSIVPLHLMTPVVSHLGSDLQQQHQSLLPSHLIKRSNPFVEVVNNLRSFLGQIGHSLSTFMYSIAKLLHPKHIYNTLRFYLHYFKVVVPVINQAVPIRCNMTQTVFNSTQELPEVPNDTKDYTAIAQDGRTQLIRDIFLPHLEHYKNLPLDQFRSVHVYTPPIVDLPLPFNPTSWIKSAANLGEKMFSQILIKTQQIVPMYANTMYSVLEHDMAHPKLRQFLNTHELLPSDVPLSYMSLMTLIVSTEATWTYMLYNHRAPFSEKDIRAIQSNSNGFYLLHDWLFDLPSGRPTPVKEYEIHTKLDWFPRIYSAITQQVNYLLRPLGMVQSFIYTLNSYLIALMIFPMPYNIHSTNEDAIRSIAPASWNMWYLWAYTCVLHLSKIPSQFAGVHNQWTRIKALSSGIPQAFIVSQLIDTLRQHLDLTLLEHKIHFSWNVMGWTFDTMSMITPVYPSLDKLLRPTELMIVSYTSRIHFMMQRGIPGVNPFYSTMLHQSLDGTVGTKYWRERDPYYHHFR